MNIALSPEIEQRLLEKVGRGEIQSADRLVELALAFYLDYDPDITDEPELRETRAAIEEARQQSGRGEAQPAGRFSRSFAPNMAFRVEILPRAKLDLAFIADWLIERSPFRGSEWLDGLERAMNSLAELPERCPVARKLSTPAGAVHQLLYGRYPHVYRIYFHVVGNVVEIMHVRHGARDKPKILELFD